MSDTEKRVQKLLVEELRVDPAKVTTDASLVDDLGADSLDIIELIMSFEEEFRVEIGDDEAEKAATVGEWIALIDGKRD